MCFCCCETRKTILIYAIVISSFAFIYGIAALSQFGSKTDIYKALIAKIKVLESSPYSVLDMDYDYTNNDNDYYHYNSYYKKKNNSTRRISNNYDYNALNIYSNDYYTNTKYAKEILDYESYIIIMSLSKEDLEENSYGFVKSLKGIENGLGVLIFVFSLLFLAINIIFLIFACGIKEYQVLSDKIFKIFNITKMICTILSIIFIFLSVIYAILLAVALVQYIGLVENIDSCANGIIIGMCYGYYGLWYYIILSCAFSKERTKFLNVGCESKPGPDAKYDINGNVLTNVNLINGPITVVIPPNQTNVQAQQLIHPVNYNKSNAIGDEYININGILYKRVDDSSSVNALMNGRGCGEAMKERSNVKRRSTQKNSQRKSLSKSNIKIQLNDNKENEKTNQNENKNN